MALTVEPVTTVWNWLRVIHSDSVFVGSSVKLPAPASVDSAKLVASRVLGAESTLNNVIFLILNW